MANDLFISYRSTDRADVELLHDGLVTVGGFDRSQVFRDLKSLAAGHDWKRQLDDAIARATAFLAVIGENWARPNAEDDWVARELAAAFRHGVPVIPILLRGTPFPDRESLPPGLEHLSESHALRIMDPSSDAAVFAVAAALRRNGIRAARETDPWAHASRFLDLESYVDQLPYGATPTEVAATGAGASRVVLLTGPPGSGRSKVLRSFLRKRPTGMLVGLHASLSSSAERECPVLEDWLCGIFEQARSSPERLRKLGDCLVKSELARAAGHLLPQRAIAAGLPIDLRLQLLHACQAAPTCEITGADPQSSVPLVIALVRTLSSTLDDVEFVFAVDDFDDVDAKSRELVRELAGSLDGLSPNIHLVLSTSDVIGTKVFLGPTECPTILIEPAMGSFIDRCVGVADPPVHDNGLREHLLAECHTPFEVETMLRHLHRVGSIIRSAEGRWAFVGTDPRHRSTVRAAIDATIDLALTPPMQQVLEVGALVGMSFAADLADIVSDPSAPTNAADDPTTLWHEIQDSDRDELIVRCRVVDGRRTITFTSSVWHNHLRGRSEDRLERHTLALGRRYAMHAGDQYGDWVTSAQLLERVGANEAAGRSYLSSARLARQQLSLGVAARRYRDAAASLSLAAVSGDPINRARTLMETAFALIQAASLRYWSCRLETIMSGLDTATPAERRTIAMLPPEFDKDLDASQRALFQLQRAMDDLPATPALLDLENLVLDLSDSYLSDLDRLTTRAHSLAAHLAILQGRGSPRPSGAAPARWEEIAERHYTSAMRDAEQGLGGQVRRFLVVLASAGLTEILTTKAERLAGESLDKEALRNVVGAALFHASRALLILRRWDDPPIDHLHAAQVEAARAEIHDCLDRLACASQRPGEEPLRLCASYEHDGQATPVETLVASWSRTLSPDAHEHAARVEAIALRLARAMGDDRIGRPVCRQEDVAMVARAHDLFGRVEPSRVLALFRELDVPNTIGRRGRQDWISCAEWSTPILLHGRLAALFLDVVLDARNRLGADRFTVIEQALASHTTGQKHPSPLARVLFVADTLQLVAGNEASGVHGRDIKQAAHEDRQLDRAYALCLAARIRLLDNVGRTPATNTLAAV